MAKYSIDGTTLTNIANPLRELRGITGGMKPEEMAANAQIVLANVAAAMNAIADKGVSVSGADSDDLAVLIAQIVGTEDLTAVLDTQDELISELEAELASKRVPILKELSVTENGTYTPGEGTDGYSSVVVNVPERELVMQEKTVTPTAAGVEVDFDAGYDGLSKVVVQGDGNLVPENIVSGKSIFGIVGNAKTGAGVNVCSVTIDWGETASIDNIYVTIFDGDTIVCVDVYQQGVDGVVVIQNAVVNSIIVVRGFYDNAEIYEGIDRIEYEFEDVGFLVKGNGSIEIS